MQKSEQEDSEERGAEPETKNMASASSQSSGESIEKDDKKMQSTPLRLEREEKQDAPKACQDLSTEKPIYDQLQAREATEGAPQPHLTSPVIIIPQVEEEADEEEPQEVMEDVPESLIKGRLTVGNQMVEDDPTSGAEDWSVQISGDGDPATDSSHLSPCSDHDLAPQLDECVRDDWLGEDEEEEEVHVCMDEGTKEEGEVVKTDRTEEDQGKEVGSDGVGEEKEVKTTEDEGEERMGEEEKDEEKDIEIGREVEETSAVSSQAAIDETAMDVSLLDTDSGWMDTQDDDDKSIMTEQIEALPQAQSPTSTPVVDRPAKRAPGRGRGPPGTPERKVSRKVPSIHPPREEMKKKKVAVRRADQIKVSALQSRSPSRKIVAKAAARHPRPALLHGSARRKVTEELFFTGMESHQPLSVAHQSRERTTVSTISTIADSL
ncbi:Microtubule-associated protein 2 [Liparis tanakae]|uniref:Microtubule-associated protein 2 n=1 Tax=Liparis tanakae TaxID=230148 RepID=A0A4Z2FYA9_9TELE|nr:Microtubule-associated protein 2 [Liparis tanakae]